MGFARTSLILTGAILLAGVSGLAATSFVNERKRPDISSTLSPYGGFGSSKLAAALIQQSTVQDGADSSINLTEEEMAQIERISVGSYLVEPLDVGAIRNIALLTDESGPAERAKSLMDAVLDLTRRDLLANGWQILYHGRKNDLEGSLRYLDYAMRTSSRGRSLFMSAMRDSLANPEAIPFMEDLLASDPGWQDEFWRDAYQSPRSVIGLADLRIGLAKRGMAGQKAADERLVAGLASAGHLQKGRELFDALTEAGTGSTEVVHNPDFTLPAAYAPYGWDIRYDDSMVTRLTPTGGGWLEVSTYGDGAGLIARQLITLDEDTYRLNVISSGWGAEGRSPFYLRIYCAEQAEGQQSARPLGIDNKQLMISFQKPVSSCRHHWLELHSRPHEQGSDRTARFERVSINEL